MVNRVAAGGLQVRPYFHRYTNDALDLCDALGSFALEAKLKLDDLSKILGLAGKPEGVAGSRVEEMVLAVGGSPSTREAAGPAEAAAGATERKRLRNIVHTCGWRGAPGACQLWTGRHR
jgi:hypothetical protein